MIIGTHALLYSTDAEKDRAFFRDVLGMKAIDSGGGWLIMALPPAELGVHPVEPGEPATAEIYLMCDNIETTVRELSAKGVECGAVQNPGWGALSVITLPSGGKLGIYQPRHALAI